MHMFDRDTCVLGVLLVFAFGQIFGFSQFVSSTLFSILGLDLHWAIEELSLLLILITSVLMIGSLYDRKRSKLRSTINFN